VHRGACPRGGAGTLPGGALARALAHTAACFAAVAAASMSRGSGAPGAEPCRPAMERSGVGAHDGGVLACAGGSGAGLSPPPPPSSNGAPRAPPARAQRGSRAGFTLGVKRRSAPLAPALLQGARLQADGLAHEP